MNPENLKAMLLNCVEEAHRTEPACSYARARCFIATLSGALSYHGDKELSDKIFSVLDFERDGTA